jgi:hypothetical protein
VTDDGRVIFTRWEYNDRHPYFSQLLLQKNPDGTGQRELYGSNSYCPTSILHARSSPNSRKYVAIYWVDIDGRRELLADDTNISCNQPIPMVQTLPPFHRPSAPDSSTKTATVFLQDVYRGPGLAGIPRGTVKPGKRGQNSFGVFRALPQVLEFINSCRVLS